MARSREEELGLPPKDTAFVQYGGNATIGDLQESKLMIDDENKDQDRKLKEAQMAMDSAADMTSNIEGIINTTVRRG